MWNVEKLQSYIDAQIEENVHLDYKASGSLVNTNEKKKEIGKDVSAFANSDGGMIIYGIREKQDQRHFPEAFDPIKRTAFTKETLEQIINSSISPKIKGVLITPVTIGAPENDDVIYIVEIPKSDTAHQASDKRYYKRYNFQSEMMEDWEIKDIINRKNKSELVVWLQPRMSKLFYPRISKTKNHKLEFELWVENTGNRSAEYVSIFLSGSTADMELFLEPSPSLVGKHFEIHFNNKHDHKVTIDGDEFVVNSQYIPLLPKVSTEIGKITILSDFILKDGLVTMMISTEDGRENVAKKITDFIHY